MSAVEKFPILLNEAEEESSAVPPCFSHEGINVCPRIPPYNPSTHSHSIYISATTTCISWQSLNETPMLLKSSSSYTR